MSSNLQMMEVSVERMSHIQSAKVPVGKTKLLDQMRQAQQDRHSSGQTEQTNY